MTWLRDVLVDLADDSPRVDLAERTIMLRERRRRTTISLVAAAMVVITALGATLTVRLLPPGPQDVATRPDELPARGVGPLSHARKIFCPAGAENCRDGSWLLVTRAGRKYYLRQALPSLRPGRDSPLAISRDGRKIAYYSAEENTFQVRDLASGQTTTAPQEIPSKRLGSVSRLMLSDDGRFVAFSKVPDLKDPALLIDMREGRTRELPNRWVPVGLSADGGFITLAEYSPKARLRTMSNLWTPSKSDHTTTVTLPQHYHFSPLAPDGATVAAIENHSTAKRPCRIGDLVLLDTRTGKKRTTTVMRGLPPGVTGVSLRTWLNADEVTVLTTTVRCRPASDTPTDKPTQTNPPNRTIHAYALNVRTGKTRKLATHITQDFSSIALPGPPGAQ
ncbi:hypothetical protein AB0I81_54495 [Nonomuraea sp. NPDC050404]|uniref:hypothetical protein n=1 Tax=Nonomuraea sp. NPDC050404 TaxID=3155783 RepID=UPI0034064777